MKKVEIKFFSSIREVLGLSSIEADLDEGIDTIDDLLKWLQNKYSAFDTESSHVLTAKNLKYVKRDEKVENGDSIAIFPPVSGG